MPRANRFFVPGHVWHVTHRCHKREFLLKFARDKCRWVHWLFEASKRFEVSILNYTVTSNHIHLLVKDKSFASEIPNTLQLVAGRAAQEFNQRKRRKGAFWEDRYHATAIQTGTHLWRGLVYVDLNMVRAGVVQHPKEWPFGGYHELVGNKTRNRILDRQALLNLLGLTDVAELKQQHQNLIDEAVSQQSLERDCRWTESVAVGSRDFVSGFQEQLKAKGKGRQVIEGQDEEWIVREGLNAYGAVFDPKN